ncbi:DNA/RNA non-specific endonuclease [Aquincola sp. J276]|uniref:DNA/RNA non-specific endonuclease n=1 Tax=Aquincola sp. J276 TaxID=2898432 RepID=UPI002150999F|nr:DNA/RNA non-specific endonuclease [Aquincola sp. J276]MCR5868225.1 DNA/RNA non-specific endonuclease [Aquincola sp. J276]
MINRREIAERQETVRKAAAARWRAHVSEVAETTASVARLGAVAAATPARRAQYLEREARKVPYRAMGFALERMIGPTLDFDDLPPTPAALEAGKPVARIVELLDRKRIGDGFATGFMLSGGLLLTNWHVFKQPGDAIGCGAQFGFQRASNGLIEGGVVFELDPESFFLSHERLDFAVVRVHIAPVIGAAALSDFNFVRLIPNTGKILAGQAVSIIQHPDGGHKRWSVRENKLVREPGEPDLFLQYTTDTLPGSSGSPAFNKDWELVAVHHSGVPRMQGENILLKNGNVWRPGVPDSDIDWVANEGVRISKLHAHLLGLAHQDPSTQSHLTSVLATSSDAASAGEILANPAATSLFAQASTGMNKGTLSEAGSKMQPNHGWPSNVVVNGTANFYFSSASTSFPRSDEISPATPQGVKNEEPGPRLGLGPVVTEKKLRFDPGYSDRAGYQSSFLDGFDVPVPIAAANEALMQDGSQMVLRYHHYSLVMHESRRLCIWAASNVNYDEATRRRTRQEFGADTWKLDPRITGAQQIDDAELYEPAKKFDRGHIVRRDDVAWGVTEEEEEFGNSDSFHFTNCTPQHEQFNRAMFEFHGLWGELENHISRQAGFVKNKLCVFAGPVLADNDPRHDFGMGTDFQVPIEYWKVIVAVEATAGAHKLRAYGFLLSQRDAIDQWGWEGRFRAGKFKEQQVSLARLTAITRVQFAAVVMAADPLSNIAEEASSRALRSLSDVRLR